MTVIPLKLYFIMASAVINLILIYFIFTLPTLPLIAFLDVGQGDSILIQDANLTQILIDAGPGPKVVSQIKQIVPFFDKTIDLVIITHPEKDHFGGLLTILKHYKINKVLLTGAVKKSSEFKVLLKELKNADVKVGLLYKNLEIKTKHFQLTTLWPLTDLLGINLDRANDSSALILIKSGGEKFLLMGDASKIIEEKIVESSKQTLTGSILKVGHHGSKTSTSVNLLEAARPKMAIISVGKNNPYKHPSSEVLELLKQHGINVWRTDLFGTIKFTLPRFKTI